MLWIFVIFSVFAAVESNQVAPTLRFAQVVLRHGDRAPIKLFPTDPNHASTWPNGLGELTTLGIQQEYALGRVIRSLYGGFINDIFDMKEIRFESTDVNRTLVSAYAVLAGMYPPVPSQTWNTDLPWYPIPVHTKPMKYDRVLNMDLPCKRYTELEDIVYSSEEVQRYMEENQEMLSLIVNKSGLAAELGDVTLMDIMLAVPQPVMIEKAHNLSVAPWVNAEVYDFLVDMDLRKTGWWYHLEEQKKLRGGRWAFDTFQRLQNHAEGTVLPKMMFQAAHDSGIVAFLDLMGAWDGLVPPYASFISLELHEDEHGEFSVKLFYKNDTISNTHTEPVPLYFPECPAPCRLENFGDMLKPWMVSSDEEHKMLCEPGDFILTIGLLITAVAVAILLTALIVAGMGFLVWRKRYAVQYRNID